MRYIWWVANARSRTQPLESRIINTSSTSNTCISYTGVNYTTIITQTSVASVISCKTTENNIRILFFRLYIIREDISKHKHISRSLVSTTDLIVDTISLTITDIAFVAHIQTRDRDCDEANEWQKRRRAHNQKLRPHP